MTANEYQKLALRTASELSKKDKLLNGVMGLNGEAGECIDIVKKTLFQGHELDNGKLKDELSDVMWYVALICTALNINLEDVMIYNIEKLKKRYPNGFESEKSINRKE